MSVTDYLAELHRVLVESIVAALQGNGTEGGSNGK